MIHHLISELLDNAALTAYSGDRIHPLVRSQGSELPCVVVQLVSMRANDTKEASSSLYVYTVHVTTFANAPSKCWAMTLQVRASLDNWSGNGTVVQSRLIDTASDVFEATEAFSFTSEFEVFSTE